MHLALAEAYEAQLDRRPAIAQWRGAAEIASRFGRHTVLRPRLELARELLAHGDREEGKQLLIALRHDAHAMGARWYEEQATLAARRFRVPLPHTDAIPGPLNALTPREREVLDLVSSGSTDRAIAAALFITEKTASTHVGRVLAKLGVPNRGQAAAWLGRLRAPPRMATNADRTRSASRVRQKRWRAGSSTTADVVRLHPRFSRDGQRAVAPASSVRPSSSDTRGIQARADRVRRWSNQCAVASCSARKRVIGGSSGAGGSTAPHGLDDGAGHRGDGARDVPRRRRRPPPPRRCRRAARPPDAARRWSRRSASPRAAGTGRARPRGRRRRCRRRWCR